MCMQSLKENATFWKSNKCGFAKKKQLKFQLV